MLGDIVLESMVMFRWDTGSWATLLSGTLFVRIGGAEAEAEAGGGVGAIAGDDDCSSFVTLLVMDVLLVAGDNMLEVL